MRKAPGAAHSSMAAPTMETPPTDSLTQRRSKLPGPSRYSSVPLRATSTLSVPSSSDDPRTGRGRWHPVERFAFDRAPTTVDRAPEWAAVPAPRPDRARVRRLVDAFGEEAAARLEAATVAVVGAGGTGSPALETLARAGVGHL